MARPTQQAKRSRTPSAATRHSLRIESLQDTSTFNSRQTTMGGSVSYTVGTGQVSVSGNYGAERQSGAFASVQEQAGITAGAGGFNINVRGATELTGGVIDSSAEPGRNTLTTGTLSATDITNTETFRASSTNLSGGVSFGNSTTDAQGNPVGRDRNGTATTNAADIANPADILATAFNSAASGNAAGSVTSLAQGVAIEFTHIYRYCATSNFPIQSITNYQEI